MNTRKQKTKAVVITLVTILIMCFLTSLFFIFSHNHHKVYKFPPQDNAVLDLDGFSFDEAKVLLTMAGEWEFFYNKWIITDNLDVEPDCLIETPKRWTGKEINGEKLKRSGYASYRLTIINAQIGNDLELCFDPHPVATRMFLNGELMFQSGILSKTAKGGLADGLEKKTAYKVENAEPIELVVEISYNNQGGLSKNPMLGAVQSEIGSIARFVSIVIYVVFGMMLAFVVFSFILNLGMNKKDRSVTFIILVLFIFLHLFCTQEVASRFGYIISFFNYGFMYVTGFITAGIILLLFMTHLLLKKAISLKKPVLFTLISVFALSALSFFLLWGTAYQIIPIAIILLGCGVIFYELLLARYRNTPYAISYSLMLLVLISTFVLETIDNLGLIIYGVTPTISILLFVNMILLSILAYRQIRNTASEAIKAADLENEIGRIKHQALQSQIKPHFIFNALSSIQALYEKDKREGSAALSVFASHLRQNIDSDKNDLISFRQEVKNIMNYAELENLRLEKKLTLLIDIDYADFEIPPLSLQPLIENAIRYADTQDKENGYIRLHSRLEENEIIVEIIDNGKGFDPNKIRNEAAGLKNCRERLEYLLNARMVINSVIGGGTTVTIRLPNAKKSH